MPRLLSAFSLLPGRAAIELIESGVRPSDAGLSRAIDAQTAALAILDRAGPHMDTAYLAQALADSSGFADADLPAVLAVVRHHLDAALSLAPAQSRGWMMLAGIRLEDGEEVDAATALDVSFAADPHSPRLAPFRWPMAKRLGGHLSRVTRERAALEFLSFFRAQPETAVRIALRQDLLAELTALASDRGEDRASLDRVLHRMRLDAPEA